MRFVDRHEELSRLRASEEAASLVVLWGRRRIGKTRLLLEWAKAADGTYWVADESAASIQRRYLAEALGARLPSFGDVEYRDWASLFDRLGKEMARARWHGPIVIDELPYLVIASPELPSVLQRFVDTAGREAQAVLAVAGSSQRMMQGLVLSPSAPLFGRAREAFQLRPLMAGWLGTAFGLRDSRRIVEAWALWGGVPRYWELASPFSDQNEAADALALNPLGPLHEEPARLLLEESPPALALRPVLDAIGAGSHRVSEIAGRIGQPATSLARPLSRLQELELVIREVPFGEAERDGKRALYRLADPFLRLWFAVVGPRRSLLLQSTRPARLRLLAAALPRLRACAWEDLCRDAVPRLQHRLGHIAFENVRRYWRGAGPEWDIVAESADRSGLLVGEAKWLRRDPSAASVRQTFQELIARGVPSVVRRPDAKIHYAVFVPRRPPDWRRAHEREHVVDASDVLASLR